MSKYTEKLDELIEAVKDSQDALKDVVDSINQYKEWLDEQIKEFKEMK